MGLLEGEKLRPEMDRRKLKFISPDLFGEE
jgi:hypothetical protein